ncbi:MAG: ABC transporter substrate-binding protein [Gammaproteobacteria bacterium]|nr:ABC transporter substrate-binding protein [Gammaproteobacteria bacterium]
MRLRTILAAGAGLAMLGFSAPKAVLAETVTATSWGGSYSMSQRKAYYEPFMKETGHTVLEDEWDGSIAMVRAMVDTGNYKTHVIDGSVAAAVAGCDEGILEPIDWDKLGMTPDDFLPGGTSECGIATIAYGTVFAYRTDVFPTDPPKSWADFWDVEKYPGKRALRKGNPQGTLEFALIADGVEPSKVYEVLKSPGGIDRAFAKLDEIKPHLIYWETGAHAPQLLADQEVVMTSGWNGRFYNAVVDDGQPFALVWNGQGLDFDYWFIPANHPEMDLAYEFLRFASRPDRQGDQTNYIAYGPMVKGADKFVNADILPHLPTAPQNTENYFIMDQQYWGDHREDLSNRMATWMAN